MKIVLGRTFKREAKPFEKKYASFDEDFEQLLNQLLNNPKSGDGLGRDCYKVRMAITSKNKGKSGGARVITCVKVLQDCIVLLSIFD